jgi:hypothetical protein
MYLSRVASYVIQLFVGMNQRGGSLTGTFVVSDTPYDVFLIVRCYWGAWNGGKGEVFSRSLEVVTEITAAWMLFPSSRWCLREGGGRKTYKYIIRTNGVGTEKSVARVRTVLMYSELLSLCTNTGRWTKSKNVNARLSWKRKYKQHFGNKCKVIVGLIGRWRLCCIYYAVCKVCMNDEFGMCKESGLGLFHVLYLQLPRRKAWKSQG